LRTYREHDEAERLTNAHFTRPGETEAQETKTLLIDLNGECVKLTACIDGLCSRRLEYFCYQLTEYVNDEVSHYKFGLPDEHR
jgi:hypothetical protein